jgi:CheY-like chemotaxis protein
MVATFAEAETERLESTRGVLWHRALDIVCTHPRWRETMALNGAEQEVHILLVEDNPGDVRLTREVLEDGRTPIHLNVVGDGEQAMAFIRREGEYQGSPRPQLVLLDLNLPRKDGREVLEELKADPQLCRIPVIVLTTSGADADILRSYDLHANCFITKPIDFDEFSAVVRSIEDFWLATARLPTG